MFGVWGWQTSTCGRGGDFVIGSGHVGDYLCVCLCVRSCLCVCVWVCVRDNPGESLSLKGNRCRFTYVEGPQPVMRLAGLGSFFTATGRCIFNKCLELGWGVRGSALREPRDKGKRGPWQAGPYGNRVAYRLHWPFIGCGTGL